MFFSKFAFELRAGAPLGQIASLVVHEVVERRADGHERSRAFVHVGIVRVLFVVLLLKHALRHSFTFGVGKRQSCGAFFGRFKQHTHALSFAQDARGVANVGSKRALVVFVRAMFLSPPRYFVVILALTFGKVCAHLTLSRELLDDAFAHRGDFRHKRELVDVLVDDVAAASRAAFAIFTHSLVQFCSLLRQHRTRWVNFWLERIRRAAFVLDFSFSFE